MDKKNKGPLIVCTVVATALVVGALTGGIGAGSAVAVGGALVGGAMDDPPPSDHINKPGEVIFQEEFSAPPPPPIHTPSISTFPISLPPHAEDIYIAIEAKTDNLKEDLSETLTNETTLPEEKSYWSELKERIRSSALYLAHEIVDKVAKIGEYYYELNPSSTTEDLIAYLDSIDATHDRIDEIFNFEKKDIDVSKLEMQIGYLPPPGSLVGTTGRALAARTGGAVGASVVGSALTQLPTTSSPIINELSLDALAEAGKEPDRAGLTKAGRALAKHGGRPNSAFPKPMGTPEQINQQGQEILEEILTDPEKSIEETSTGNIKIFNQNGRGALFGKDGRLIGFIEGQYE